MTVKGRWILIIPIIIYIIYLLIPFLQPKFYDILIPLCIVIFIIAQLALGMFLLDLDPLHYKTDEKIFNKLKWYCIFYYIFLIVGYVIIYFIKTIKYIDDKLTFKI